MRDDGRAAGAADHRARAERAEGPEPPKRSRSRRSAAPATAPAAKATPTPSRRLRAVATATATPQRVKTSAQAGARPRRTKQAAGREPPRSGEFGFEGTGGSSPVRRPRRRAPSAASRGERRRRVVAGAAAARASPQPGVQGSGGGGEFGFEGGLKSCAYAAHLADTPGLIEYLTRFAGQDEVLARVERETRERPNAAMLSRPDQGALLTLLARMLGAREALEIGTFTGYGAICIARGLAEGGRLTCFEVDEEIARGRAGERRGGGARGSRDGRGRAGRRGAGARSRGAARSTSPTSTPTRTGYPGYYDALVPRDAAGRADRARQHAARRARARARGTSAASGWPRSTSGSPADERVDSVLLGLADGVTIARRC